MLFRKILFLTNGVRSSFVSRTYRNVKVKHVKANEKDVIKGNPGGNRTLAMVLEGESPDMSNVTLEDIEDGENDLVHSHLLYDQHNEELKKQKQVKSFHNIKRKYFKSKTVLPNFLTYFEKQQIKHLYEKSPKEWNPETLSTCFPATSEIIIKILKSKWIANEGQQILRHDKLVQQNWEHFRDGSFKDILSDKLNNHLSKFSGRRSTLITLEEAEAHIPKPASAYLKPGEFGQIITSFIGEPVIQNKQNQIEAKEIPAIERIYENDTKTSIKRKHFTLNEFKNDVQKESFSWYTPQSLPTSDKSVDTAKIEASLKENTSIISRKEISKFIHTINNYPLAIQIPRKVWKEGFTYKVKDCFYDDNGDFLYRVPGLTTDEDQQQEFE